MTNSKDLIQNSFLKADKETRQFLNKFNDFTIESVEAESVTFTNGIKVSYNLKVSSMALNALIKNSNNKYALPIQVVANVTMNGTYAESFGCVDSHDNNLMLVWFELMRNAGRDMSRMEEANTNEEYNNLINS